METKVAEFAQKLGARIVQLRKEHNFAQERLATLARMNKGYLSSVESGQRIPSVGMLARLSKVLQVQIFDLFVFPDGGPMDRLWEEIRKGTSSAAEQLRTQFGIGANGAAKPTGKVMQKAARAQPRATASAKRKPSKVTTPTKARPSSPNRSATRRTAKPAARPTKSRRKP